MVSDAQKRATEKWRESHKEKYLAKQREYQNKYYKDNIVSILDNKRKYYISVLKPKKEAKKAEKLAQSLPEVITHELPETLSEIADLTNLTGPEGGL